MEVLCIFNKILLSLLAVLTLVSTAFACPEPPANLTGFHVPPWVQPLELPIPVKEPTRYSEVVLSHKERAIAALTIYHEARGESREGQRAVMEVILNRLLSDKWPNSIEEIVYAPRQFAVASYLTTANINEPECLSIAFEVVDEVLSSDEYILPEGYVYFATSKINGRDFIEIGNHYFSRG